MSGRLHQRWTIGDGEIELDITTRTPFAPEDYSAIATAIIALEKLVEVLAHGEARPS